MSGTRLTRKVTVEGTKKVQAEPIPNPRRLSVFERLGPGAVEVKWIEYLRALKMF